MSPTNMDDVSRPVNATISVMGRFHAFYLARALQDAGSLERLITSYPVFETVKYGVDRSHIRSLLIHELAARFWRKLPAPLRRLHNITHQNMAAFDWNVARRLDDRSSVFIGWSGGSLRSLGRAKDLGMATFLERGSSHMAHQQAILAEEYELNGLEHGGHHPAITERELAEYERTDYVCVPSLYAWRSFIEKGFPKEKLLINPYGVDLRHFPRREKPDDVFRVVFCGALSVRKGLIYLLKAFSELNLPNSELLLIGSRQAETEPLLARFASDRIRHVGPFREFDLHEYYRLGSVFCLPSIEDGFGMVLVQAMASGLPLICSTNTGGADLIAEDREGFVVPVRDVDALKQKILFLYENPDIRAEMADAARARAEADFTWDHYGARALALYRAGLGPS